VDTRTVEHSGYAVGGPPVGGVDVVTTTTITDSVPGGADREATVTKVIVAVHGIGDQHNFATIQTVVNRFCSYFCYPAAVPLGSFHTAEKPYAFQAPYPSKDPFRRFAFAEVYWAGISRKVVDEKYTIEETKQWAGTIVERLWLRWKENPAQATYTERDFRLMKQVLGEMIETIVVLDRISFLADKAGLFKFELRKLLDDYLGDVQIVADFEVQRNAILKAFADGIDKAHEAYPNADIYIVAHSEGTVVSLLGLLAAFRQATLPRWADHVRGFMTLGSPIDKHLVLWPELFRRPDATGDPHHAPPRPIKWRNYYDFGDPVGFALDDARRWIEQHAWTDVFEFTDEAGHDNGFARYLLPGKAHTDYWNDKDVFGHFIQNVIGEKPQPPDDFSEPPADVQRNKWISYMLPYLGVFALLVGATFILYKALTNAMDPGGDVFGSPKVIATGVFGVAALLSGITAVARIPRLTRSAFWRAVAVAGGVLGALVYFWSVREFAPTVLWNMTLPPGAVTFGLAILVVVVTYLTSWLRPSWGMRPLILSGAGAVAVLIAQHLRDVDRGDGALWPVLFAAAAFLYLWWIAALLFDLVFVWHVYIRHANALRRMDEILGHERGAQHAHTEPVAA
jgi:hypothetical protein